MQTSGFVMSHVVVHGAIYRLAVRIRWSFANYSLSFQLQCLLSMCTEYFCRQLPFSILWEKSLFILELVLCSLHASGIRLKSCGAMRCCSCSKILPLIIISIFLYVITLSLPLIDSSLSAGLWWCQESCCCAEVLLPGSGTWSQHRSVADVDFPALWSLMPSGRLVKHSKKN